MIKILNYILPLLIKDLDSTNTKTDSSGQMFQFGIALFGIELCCFELSQVLYRFFSSHD